MKELIIYAEEDHSTPTTAVTSFTVTVPFIVNTEAIAVGKEIVVKVDKLEKRVTTAISHQKGKSSLHSASKLPAAARMPEGKDSLRTACWGSAG